MASGPVRELITSIKFKLDMASLNKANQAIDRLKNKLRQLGNLTATVHVRAEGTSSALSAIQRVRSQLNSLNGASARVNINHQQNGGAGPHGGGNPTGGNGPTGGGSSKLQKFADAGAGAFAAGAGMIGATVLPVKTAMDFEAAMAKVKAITNSTDADMAKLTQQARELGASTQFSASEAASAMSYLGMAGWKTEQIMAGMPGLLNLAAASGEDLARVSDIVSDDLTAFKMPAEQAGHMADVMAAASSNANTNVSMMGETFKYVGPVAGSLGYTLEDVSLATGLMANASIKGEQAGTSLRGIITRLLKPSKEAGTYLDMLANSTGVAVNQMTNADGSMKPFRQTILEMRAAFGSLSEAEKAEYAASIAGQEAMSGFLALINASDEDFNKLAGAIDKADGSSDRMAKTMSSTLSGQIKSLKSAFEELEIEAGKQLIPGLLKIVQAITELARKFGEFAKENPKLASGLMAFVAVTGALLTVLGAVGIVLGALMPIITAIGSIGIATFGAIVAAVLGVIAIIVLLIAYWDELYAWVKNNCEYIVNTVSQAATQIYQWFSEKLEAVKNAFTAMKDHAINMISEIVNAIGNWLGSKIQWAKDALSSLSDWASSKVDAVFNSKGGGGGTYTQNNYVSGYTASDAASYVTGAGTSWYPG